MALVSLFMLCVGVVLSAVSGLVCYAGPTYLGDHMASLPLADLVLSNPAAALGIGGLMTVVSAFAHPSRVE
ncbi:MAG: hypothetical protein DCC65_13460 [Planctomycetota bacterium]|nr:MAG: hypothetical protein DCC65_13460 [Planctomycetota bacterium]